jgi:F0F1-type ATP synthase beta subunit
MVDVLTSRSRLLETKAAGREHVTIANRVRKALASLWSEQKPKSRAVRLAQERALKLQNYFTQPFSLVRDTRDTYARVSPHRAPNAGHAGHLRARKSA